MFAEEAEVNSEVQVVQTDEAPVMRAWPPVPNKDQKKIYGMTTDTKGIG